MPDPVVRVCFVCSGNICRSPTAEVVLQAQAEAAGVADRLVIDSAGVGAWHVGADMDERSRATLEAAGYHPGPHHARVFEALDFDTHDVIVGLDRGHVEDLRDFADEASDPEAASARIVLLRADDPDRAGEDDVDVADPYYDGERGFAEVLAQIERSTAALLTRLLADE